MEEQLKQDIVKIAKEMRAQLTVDDVILETPRNPEHGDLATNAAVMIAKQIGQNPAELAKNLCAELNELDYVGQGKDLSEFNAVGIFANTSFSSDYVKQVLNDVDAEFGRHRAGAGQKVMIEFGQPNTHKAFHVGHLKSAISGLALVGLYKNLGYEVVQANFYGDIGMHVAKCTWGALRKGLPAGIENMDVHERMKLIDSFYVFGSAQFSEDKTAEAEIRDINSQIYQGADTDAVKMYKQLRDWSLEHLDSAFARLGIVYDRQYPESEVYQEAIDIVNEHKGGIFVESDSAWIFPGEKEGLNNWVFITQEGHPTYEAKDLALAYKKFQEYNPDLSIITTSVEQSARFKAIIAILERIDNKFKDRYKHIPFGWLLRNNKKTSSRMGESIKGVDVIDEAVAAASQRISDNRDYANSEQQQIAETVGLAGLKFLILSHEFHKDINYDPDEFTSFEGFSGPYILYTIARCNSILEQADIQQVSDLSDQLNEPEEQDVLKLLRRYPDITQAAARNNAPHLLCHYLYNLGVNFNKFYEKHTVLKAETEDQKNSRLMLVNAVRQVLQNGLNVLSIDTVQKL